jgi:hypothetical protein
MASNETKADAWDIGLAIEQLTASATALEAKDAEIARLRTILCECATAIGNGAVMSPTCSLEFMQHLPAEIAANAEKRKSRITSLERQLAEETERCARVAETPDVWKRFTGDFEGNCIAAAIRGGAK